MADIFVGLWFLCFYVQLLSFYQVHANIVASYTLKKTKVHKKTEKHFQYVAQNLIPDKNSEYFAA